MEPGKCLYPQAGPVPMPPDTVTIARKGPVLKLLSFIRVSTIAAVFAVSSVLALPAAAEMAPSSENGRYALQKTEGGWFRVDTRTGQASLCADGSNGFSCELVPDDRDAMLDEIERLNDRLAILERQIGLAGETPAGSGGDVAQAPGGEGESQEPQSDVPSLMPSEEQMDEIMRGFEGMVRRFLAMVQSLREEYGQGI